MNQIQESRMRHRVLVIDDDDLVRETLRLALEGANFEVVEATDGEKGIRIYEVEPIDLVITDILMPEKEGIETIIELRRKDPDVRIVAISGGDRIGGIQFLELAGKLGADRMLSKPFRVEALLKAVRDLLPDD